MFKKLSTPKAITWMFMLLGVNFALILMQFTIPFVSELFMGSEIFLIPMGVFTILGILFLIGAKAQKKHKIKLMVVAISAISPFIAVVMHNLLYALATMIENQILKAIVEAGEVAFFLLAIPVAPIVFLISYIVAIKPIATLH